jgi:large subunit ribosomal protein L5e
MVTQDNNKYLTPRYRLVARITNTKVITQIVYSTLAGDRILCQATSEELKKYGLTAGLTSYSAAYATGLLLARKVLA